MRITTWISTACISIAMVLSILLGKAATADSEARNSVTDKREEKQKDRVQPAAKSVEPTAKKVREPRDPAVNARQENQKDRIVHGVASGELTKKEAKELVEERRDIKQLEQGYKSDGVLTTKERKDLHQQLDQAGEEIREEKHDQQQR